MLDRKQTPPLPLVTKTSNNTMDVLNVFDCRFTIAATKNHYNYLTFFGLTDSYKANTNSPASTQPDHYFLPYPPWIFNIEAITKVVSGTVCENTQNGGPRSEERSPEDVLLWGPAMFNLSLDIYIGSPAGCC